MIVQEVLDAVGIYTYHFGAYEEYARLSISGLTLEQAIQRYWLPLAIRSATIQSAAKMGVATKDLLKSYRFAIFVGTDGWGYNPVGSYDYNVLIQYDAKRAYGLFKDASGNYTVLDKIDGFVVDEPFLMDAIYKPRLNSFLTNNGVDLPSVSIGGWPTSDGATLKGWYKRAKGDTLGYNLAAGGFSIDSLNRFTQTPYFNSNHSDTSSCKLQEHFISKTITYTINELALDTYKYHYADNAYPFYLVYTNALLERQIYDYIVQIYGRPFVERGVFYPWPDLDKQIFNGVSIGAWPLGLAWPVFMRGVNMSLYLNLFNSNRFPPHGGNNNSIDGNFRPPTASECLATYLKWLPFYPHNQYYDFSYWPAEITLDEEKTRITRQYTDYLNRMKFVGGYHGYERPDTYEIRVLVYTYPGVNFTDAIDEHQYTSMAQVEVMGDPDPNMNVLASETYNIIVIENPYPAGYGITALGWQRIRDFVSNGGCLMITYLDNFKSTVFEDLTGVHFTGVAASHGTLTAPNPDHPILKPYRDAILPAYNPTYYDKGGVRQIIFTDIEVLIQSNCGPVCWVRKNYGQGMVIVLQKGTGWPAAETRQGSTFYTIRGNAFLYAKGQANLIPWMWHDSYTNGYPWGNPNYAGNKVNMWAVPTWASDFTGLIWSLCGKLGGPLLLWVSNVFTAQKDFNVHLRSGFFGLANEWVLFDAVSLNVIRGVGEDIKAQLSLAPTSWMPLYVISLPVEGSDIYCSGKVLSRTITDKDTLLSVDEGSHTALTYLVIRMSTKPARIIIDSTEVPEAAREAMAMPQTYVDEVITEKGWYYNATNQILVLKYRANNLISTVDIVRTEATGLAKGTVDGSVSDQSALGETVNISMTKPDGSVDALTASTQADGTFSTPEYTAIKAGDYKAQAKMDEDADFLTATSNEIIIPIPKAPRTIVIRWTPK